MLKKVLKWRESWNKCDWQKWRETKLAYSKQEWREKTWDSKAKNSKVGKYNNTKVGKHDMCLCGLFHIVIKYHPFTLSMSKET